MDMQEALFCNACGAQLTEPLTIVSDKDPSIEAPRFEAGLTLAARGTAYASSEPIVRSRGDTPANLQFSPQHWIDPDDLTDRVSETRKRGRLNGCCGFDGLDGPNQVCRCGAEVGTLQSDCWTPLVFIPEPEATSWRPFPGGMPMVSP
jgi:hypothetical protein